MSLNHMNNENKSLEDRIKQLEQELVEAKRDLDKMEKNNKCLRYVLLQVADYIGMPVFYGQPVGNYNKYLAEHDARVIQSALYDLSTAIRADFIGVSVMGEIEEFIDDYANQLRQKAQEK